MSEKFERWYLEGLTKEELIELVLSMESKPCSFYKGQEVEVRKIWASSQEGPLYEWFKGYTIETIEKETVIVSYKSGIQHYVRYDKRDIRPING